MLISFGRLCVRLFSASNYVRLIKMNAQLFFVFAASFILWTLSYFLQSAQSLQDLQLIIT